MGANVASRMQTFSKEHRQSRLKDFFQRDITERQGAPGAPVRYSLVAQSPASPIALALSSVQSELAAAGIAVEAVFLRIDSIREGDGASILAGSGVSCRVLTDLRLIDLHEQLVLGERSTWIGDCMRRDPTRRDTFELFGEGSASTVAWASRSFERVWSAAVPVDLARAAKSAAPLSPRDLIAPALLGTPDDMPVVVASRH